MNSWGIEDGNVNQGSDNEMTGPKALRDAYEAQKRKSEELENSLKSIQKELTQQKVSATLSTMGVPAAAASLYQGDADPEKVAEWVTTMRSAFGGGAPNAPTTVEQSQPAIDPATASKLQSFNEAGQSGTPLSNADAAMGRINDATDMKSLLAAWSSMGS